MPLNVKDDVREVLEEEMGRWAPGDPEGLRVKRAQREIGENEVS